MTAVHNFSTPVTSNITLYAKWNPVTYTVAYNANGGSGSMGNQDHIYGQSKNLNTNTFTRANYVFAGWATSASGAVVYTDGQSVSTLTTTNGDTITLYAVWHLPNNVPGSSLAQKLSWLQTNAVSNTDYTIEVSDNESIGPHSLSYSGRSNIGITLISTGAERIISLTANGSLFTVTTGVILTLDNNITLQGRTSNNLSLVRVNSGGTLVMNIGAHIKGNTISTNVEQSGGGVTVNGTFIMNGGEIYGNAVSVSNGNIGSGGGVSVVNTGIFTMNGGLITGNNASSYGGGVIVLNSGTFTMNSGEIAGNGNDSSGYGGGVCIGTASTPGGTFTMNNGKISGNTAFNGGGVYSGSLLSTDIFTMHGGEISGNTAVSFGGGVYGGVFTMYGGKISGNTLTSSTGGNGGGVYVLSTFIMDGGEISGNGNSVLGNTRSRGGGVSVSGSSTFHIRNGVIYGSGEAVNLRNTAYSGAALSSSGITTSQYGTFSGLTWISNGNLTTTNNTIKVVNGVLQP
jgi:uncharacterized repeat protein (TIGR02543 family)